MGGGERSARGVGIARAIALGVKAQGGLEGDIQGADRARQFLRPLEPPRFKRLKKYMILNRVPAKGRGYSKRRAHSKVSISLWTRFNGDKKKPGGEPGCKRLMMRETRRTLVSIF
jgi:hypothetical protein